jgi:hypothetical protein
LLLVLDDPAFVRTLRRRTKGNAFFIEETLWTLADDDLPEVVDERALLALPVTRRVAEVIVRRVGQPSDLARR